MELPTLETATREILVAEIERLWENEAISEETSLKLEEWTDAFFRAQGLTHLIRVYHNYIYDCFDNDDEQNPYIKESE